MANTVKKYLKNLDKETTQAGNAGETLRVLKGTPKGKAAANKLRNERGQMLGALLQGRRYDEKGKQITKTTPVSKSKPKPTLPSLAEYKKSAAYKTGSQTYKQYLEIAKQLQKAKKK